MKDIPHFLLLSSFLSFESRQRFVILHVSEVKKHDIALETSRWTAFFNYVESVYPDFCLRRGRRRRDGCEMNMNGSKATLKPLEMVNCVMPNSSKKTRKKSFLSLSYKRAGAEE